MRPDPRLTRLTYVAQVIRGLGWHARESGSGAARRAPRACSIACLLANTRAASVACGPRRGRRTLRLAPGTRPDPDPDPGLEIALLRRSERRRRAPSPRRGRTDGAAQRAARTLHWVSWRSREAGRQAPETRASALGPRPGARGAHASGGGAASEERGAAHEGKRARDLPIWWERGGEGTSPAFYPLYDIQFVATAMAAHLVTDSRTGRDASGPAGLGWARSRIGRWNEFRVGRGAGRR